MNRTDPPLDAAVLEAGIQWLVRMRFDVPDAATVERFERWLGESPEHERAWQSVSQAGERFANLPPALSRRTLGGVRERMSRRQSLKMLGLFAASGALLWQAREHTPLPGLMAQYRSDVGERRLVELGEGSRIHMNSDSAFDSAFDGQSWRIRLYRGELLVEVAGEDRRPLWVMGRDGQVRGQASRFLLNQHHSGFSTLAVRDGEVSLFGDPQTTAVARVAAGEQVRFDADGVRPALSDGLDPWAWTDGVIRAADMRLDAFLSELSRHRRGLLVCRDEVAHLRVSGTYQLDDTRQILGLLALALPVRVDYRTDYWVTVSARA
ncbi:DUF4880 domain-containing protein [Pseudomonas mendocina]|nr:DUF4880 domain-containing protein [Pseudomonas mendocina]MBH3337650.1 DUF4880 domain-containing protein [Pseudomonas mendocina]